MDDEDKFENGNEKYASVAACQKEITNKIQQDRPQLEREKLKHSRDCMNAFIETPQLEKERSHFYSLDSSCSTSAVGRYVSDAQRRLRKHPHHGRRRRIRHLLSGRRRRHFHSWNQRL